MMYRLKVEPQALSDIREISEWYNDKQAGLGDRFKKIVKKQIDDLKNNPSIWPVRYMQIRCTLVRKFPYMVHFYINEEIKTVEILAVISTDRNPNLWLEKTGR